MRAVLLAVVAILVYMGVTAAQVWRTAHRDNTSKAQAIIVMGAAQYDGTPSPDLAARLSHALALWRRNVAPVIVVTGGKEPGDLTTEAAASASWLAARGVPQSAILREVQGRDSYESLAASAAFLAARGIGRVVLVSDPYHEARVLAIASELGLTAAPSPTATSPIRGAALAEAYLRETVAVAAGRVLGYRRLSKWLHGAG